MDPKTAYAQKFDETVIVFNKWLESLKNPKSQRRDKLRALLAGSGSILDISGDTPIDSNARNIHPLYSRKDLTHYQKDAVALASDWKRVEMNLDKILSDNSSDGQISVEDARAGKAMAQKMYAHFRDIYFSDELKYALK